MVSISFVWLLLPLFFLLYFLNSYPWRKLNELLRRLQDHPQKEYLRELLLEIDFTTIYFYSPRRQTVQTTQFSDLKVTMTWGAFFWENPNPDSRIQKRFMNP